MTVQIAKALLGLIGLVLAATVSLVSFAANTDEAISNPEIAGHLSSGSGVWRVRTQQVFDPAERKLVRRRYEVWDAGASDDLDFVWIPASIAADKEGKVNREGRLIWRFKGKPAYDPASVFSEFRGMMRDGRAEGRGAYFDRTGLAYEGEWKGCCRRRESAQRWRRKPRRGGQPSTSVAEYGWVASPVKAGLRPPPPAADGLDRACRPAIVCHQGFDGKERLSASKGHANFFRCAIFMRILTAIHKGGLMEGYGVLKLPNGDEYAGQMRAGKADGSGRYVDFTGEAFVGRFANGLREGRGTTTLPNGTSYASVWVDGRETADSRQVRIAQAPGQPMPGGDDDIRIGITVDRKGAREGDLRYVSSNSARLFIRPDSKRLMDMWKGGASIELAEQEDGGGEEYGVFSVSRGQLFPLTLVMEVQNRSSAPIQVVDAYLSVDSSTSELQPAIQLSTGLAPCGGGEYAPTFKLENFGWSAAEDGALKFGFAGPAVGPESASLPITKNIGRIDDRLEVNLESELKAAGVDTNALAERSERGFVCSTRNQQICLNEIRGTGLFGSLERFIGIQDFTILVRAAGVLSYRWQDSKGTAQHSSSPFNAKLSLGHVTIDAECGEGGEREPIPSKPLNFHLDRSNYQMPLEFDRTIAAEHRSRLAVTFASEKSSWNEFNFVVRLSNGREIKSRTINLLYYVPKWFPSP